jgi:hypothetical protein
MDKHYIEDLTIKQIEGVLKLRKEIEAVFIAPATKAAKAIVAATADKPAKTGKGKRKMSPEAKAQLSKAMKAVWAKRNAGKPAKKAK